MRRLENQPQTVPSVAHLQKPEVQAEVAREVAAQLRPTQMQLPASRPRSTLRRSLPKRRSMVIAQTIDIPRILVVPTGEVRAGFQPFTLELGTLNTRRRRTNFGFSICEPTSREVVTLGKGGIEEARMEDYVVSGLVDYRRRIVRRQRRLAVRSCGPNGAAFPRLSSEEDTQGSPLLPTTTLPSSSMRRCRTIIGRKRPATRSR